MLKRRKNKAGYLLLETMIAMGIIIGGTLFTMSSITHLLLEEKRAQKELELTVLLHEMALSTRLEKRGEQAILKKSNEQNVVITVWEENQIRIESEGVSIGVKRK